MTKIIFSHGKESGPWGAKIKYLADIASANGFEVESVDYRSTELADERVNILTEVAADSIANELILVGSSMGGYVSTVFSSQHEVKGVFLLAPALGMPGYDTQYCKPKCAHVAIVHGWHDDIIPAENSIDFAKENNCTLHLIDGDHRLNDQLKLLGDLFLLFLKELKAIKKL